MADVLQEIKNVHQKIGAEIEEFQERKSNSGGALWQCFAHYQGIHSFIQFDATTHYMHLNAKLGAMPKANIAPLYRVLLESSYSLINANFAIDAESNSIMVVANTGIKSLDNELPGFLYDWFHSFYTNVLAVVPDIQRNFNI